MKELSQKNLSNVFGSGYNHAFEKLGVEVVAIDGKTHRGSYDRESQLKALHTVSAWSSEHRLVLGQTKVSDKSNEITAIPALLEMLDISGCIITIDAMGTQKSIAKKIIEADADYVLSLKDNHPTLHQQVKNWFETSLSLGFKDVDVNISQRVEKGHNRIENRKVYTVPISQLPALYEQDDWVGLTTVIMVVRSIQHWNKTTNEVQFYISSLASDANKLGSAIRQHWGIENSAHWTLDVTFHEDECRIRSLHSPQNFALLRRIALNAKDARIIFSSQYSPKITASRYSLSVYAFCVSGGCFKL